MPLDFHIAATKELAKKSAPDYQADEVAHAKLFAWPLPENAGIQKIRDYYADAHFAHQELPALHAELVAIMADFLDRQVFNLLFQLATLVEKAMTQQQDIFVFAD